MAPSQEGRVLDMSAQGVTLDSWLSLQELPGGSNRASDIWGYVSPQGREYALIGLARGTAFVDITNPTLPVVVGYVASPSSVWKEVSSYQEYAYVVTEAGEGMQVIDLRQVDQGSVSLARVVTAEGLSSSHTIRVNPESGFLYLNGTNLDNGGLVCFDVRDPADPQFAGAWDDTYVHDSFTTTYTTGPYAGREITFACLGPNGLGILDVTDKSNVTTLSITEYPYVSYCHYGWLDEAKRYFYVNDELDELNYPGLTSTTYVLDVTDLAHPQFVRSFTNGSTAIDHNPIGRGRYLFEANYRSGLRIYDVGDLQNVREVGWFDTYPDDDDPNFNGAWGVHVMPSGVAIVSDIERGLFVLQADATSSAPGGPGGAGGEASLWAWPNPAPGAVMLNFELARPSRASLSVFDAAGRRVASLTEGLFSAPRTEVRWNPGAAARVGKGVYYAVLSTEEGRKSLKIVVTR